MDEHIHIIISIIVICFIFLLTTLPQSYCELPPPPQQPLPNYSICREQSYSYSCGKLSNIDFYPFWGGNNRPAYCGGGDPFHLNCNNDLDTTTILIGSQNFTVMDIHPENHTMRMVRTDLAHDVCSRIFNDTYLIPTLFRYPPGLGIVRFITIFYDCPSDVIRTYGYPVFCVNATSHPGTKDEGLEAYPDYRRCGRHVQVPYSTLPPGAPVTEGLEGVIEAGFEVEYTVDQECTRCLGRGRRMRSDDERPSCWNSSDTDDIRRHVQQSCHYCRDGSVSTHCSAPKSMSSYPSVSMPEGVGVDQPCD